MVIPVVVRDFLVESDFHGVRFWFAPSVNVMRRVLWVVVFLCSATGLGYMIVHRVTYYYTYPTSSDLTTDNKLVPLPGIALCPPIGETVLPSLGERMSQSFVLQKLSDVHLAMLLKETGTGIDVLTEDETRGKFVINKELQKLAKYLSELRARNNSFSTTNSDMIGSFVKIYDYYDAAIFWMIIERVKNMDENMALPQTPGTEYLEYRDKIGMRKEYVHCWAYLSSRTVDCTEYLRQVVAGDTACMVLDNINGTFYFTNLNAIGLAANLIILTTLFDLKWSGEIPRVYLYDRRESPYYGYGTVQDMFLVNQSVTLTKVVSHEYLSVPYRDEPCIETTKTRCMEGCFAASSDCVLHYFADVEIRKNKPRCKLFQVPTIEGKSALACIESCSSTCHRRQFFTGDSRMSGVLLPSHSPNTFWLEPFRHLTHEVSVQVPLYPAGSLFAELGGTMGLFLGASVLTLYHCVAYSGAKIWRFISNLPK